MIVIDTSIVIAILNEEPEKEVSINRIIDDGKSIISAVSVYEAMLVASRLRGPGGATAVMSLLASLNVEIVSFESNDSKLAHDAYMRFGKGFHSKARLNLCDCVAFALAEKLNAPLLFKGDDFASTSITSATSAS